MKKLFFAILFLFTIEGFSQFSKTHYIPPLANSYYISAQTNSNNQEAEDQYLYISCPSETDVNFKIIQIGGTVLTGKVSLNKPYVYKIGNGPNTQLLISNSNVGKIMKNKGFIVEAEDMVYVTVRLTATKNGPEPPTQAGGLVSKGLAALGKRFRIGAFTDTSLDNYNGSVYTFATILATENNTKVSFTDIKAGVTLVNKPNVGNKPDAIILNQGESYAIAVQGAANSFALSNQANRDGLIGALISSDKPVVVNCGSFMGTNGMTSQKMDIGTDQIVPADRTGTEYIFIKGNGLNYVEKPLIVADSDQTDIYVNGSATPYKTLKAGEYLALNGSNFTADGNLYVKTSKSVFAYQGIGGTDNEANQNLHFVPPLRCETPKTINNIPLINKIGDDPNYIATVCIVTGTGADLTFRINGTSYTLAELKSKYPVKGPFSVAGNADYVTYKIENLTGNISVSSTKQVYVSYFGSSGNATYGGFYSGFTFNPEISFGTVNSATISCIPNIKLSVNSLSAFDYFQWYLNGNPIDNTNSNNYTPTAPGFYHVVAKILECNTELSSSDIPVSICPPDYDQDSIPDNLDADIDNDGIINCMESLGNYDLNLSVNSATISQGSYSNSYNLNPVVTGITSAIPFSGTTNGSFVTEVPIGRDNSFSQKISFQKPESLVMEYVSTANSTDLLTSNGDFVLEVPFTNIITVLNPDNQLLIDTNYDGIYESGIKEFSSFQIRFRLNNAGQNLPAGTGTFKFLCRLVDSFTFTHKNLSETLNDRATFKLYASCLPKDSDNDGIYDIFDLDDDNDGILSLAENLGQNYLTNTFVDANKDGLNDVFASVSTPLDFDNDGVANYLDLDSDNDGIYDLAEAGHNAADLDNNGIIDGNSVDFGTNGLFNSLETFADSGVVNYVITSSDQDGFQNYIDLDSDSDGCFDVNEAGFSDPDSDGHLGNSTDSVNSSGKVIATDGYTAPNQNYLTATPITILTQPQDVIFCAFQSVEMMIKLEQNDILYNWQMSSDGINYSDITDDATFLGSKTATLKLINIEPSMSGYKFRVVLSRERNVCNLISAEAALKLLDPPVFDSVEIHDLSENNSLKINVSGKGEYEYRIENAQETFPYQDSNYFENIEPGFYTAYINDKNGCGTVSKEIVVLGGLPYFTPNGDGINDTWMIKGISPTFYKDAKVCIYDRFGKLLKVLTVENTQGWDGTYEGLALPADDYWFQVIVGDGRIGKGHFSLLR
ncbi:MAG: T9SS type B sorting domain-containing protein [Flavobacterium sp.]